jgi:hypothetical protein
MNTSHYDHLRRAHYDFSMPRGFCNDDIVRAKLPILDHNPGSFPKPTAHMGRLNKAQLLLNKYHTFSIDTQQALERDYSVEFAQLRNPPTTPTP